MSKPFSIRSRLHSFKYAFEGIAEMLKTQHNAWVHLAATICVLLTGLVLGFSRDEWCLIILAIVAVWTAEALNTAFEFLADVASPGYHPKVKQAKDVAAGAVLITALGAVAVGMLVLTPRMRVALGW